METKEFAKTMKGVSNGFLHLFINLIIIVMIVMSAVGFAYPDILVLSIISFCILTMAWVLHIIGFVLIQPNMSVVLT